MAVDGNTSIRISNVPCGFCWASVVEMLDSQGLNGLYNFVHVPVDGDSGESVGYAVVNMVSDHVAELAMLLLRAFDGWQESLKVEWNNQQGVDNLIEMLRDSEIMHECVPDKYKPVLFVTGSRVPFPEPVDEIQQPPLFVRSMIAGESDTENVDLMMVVRHTFVDIVDECNQEDNTFGVVSRRRRCFTDSEIVGTKFDDFDLATSVSAGDCGGVSDLECGCGSESDRASENLEVVEVSRAHQRPAMQAQLQVVWMPVSYTPIGHSVPGHSHAHMTSTGSSKRANRSSNLASKRVERVARRSQRLVSPRTEKSGAKMPMERSVKKRTTLLLKNIPSDVDKLTLLNMLNDQGFSGLYNFVHVEPRGRAYVNLISEHVAELASHLIRAFDGWKSMVEVCWSDDHQGLDDLSKNFTNDAASV